MTLTYLFKVQNGPLKATLNSTLLVATVDPSETRPGPGAVDMAFVVYLKDGSISSLTPVYPGGMAHPNATPPDGAAAQGDTKLYLHDTFWWNDTNKDAKLAQETVEYNTGIKTDAVVVVKPTAIDAVLKSIGGVDVPGQGHVTNNSVEFLRDEQKYGMSRGGAVESLAYAVKDASNDKKKRSAIIDAIIAQYTQGNVLIIPGDFGYKLITAESLNRVLG